MLKSLNSIDHILGFQGVSRTGTIVAIEFILEKMLHGDASDDSSEMIKELRKQRALAIRTAMVRLISLIFHSLNLYLNILRHCNKISGNRVSLGVRAKGGDKHAKFHVSSSANMHRICVSLTSLVNKTQMQIGQKNKYGHS